MATSNEKIIVSVETTVKGDESVKKAQTSIDKLSASNKKNAESAEKSGGAFKKLGENLKSFGSSLGFVGGFGLLIKVLSESQPVIDALNIALNTATAIFQQVSDAISRAFDETSKATGGFKSLSAVLTGVVGVALNYIKAVFYEVKLALLAFRLVWEQSPFGKGDTKKITELNVAIAETADNIAKSGKAIYDNGKKVVDNIGGAIKETVAFGEAAAKQLEKVDIKKAGSDAKSLVALEKNAKLQEAIQNKLAAQYDRQAEKLRQVRDDDTKGIEERIKANNDLKGVLDEQAIAMGAAAQAQVDAAQARYNLNKTIENQVALTNAEANAASVAADIEGKRSEQKQNEVNLRKENNALIKDAINYETELYNKKLDFNTSLIENDYTRVQNELSNIEIKRNTELATLKQQYEDIKENNTLKAEAYKKYKDLETELDNQTLQKKKEKAEIEKNIDLKLNSDRIDVNNKTQELLNYSFGINLGKRIKLIESSYTEEKALLTKKYNDEKKAATGNADAIKAIEEKYALDLELLDKKRISDKAKAVAGAIDAITKYAQTALSIASAMSDIKRQEEEQAMINSQKETDRINQDINNKSEAYNRELEARRAAIEGMNISDEERARLLQQLDNESINQQNKFNQEKYDAEMALFKATDEIKRKQFERDKKYQIAQAIINTAASIGMALGTVPFPASIGVIASNAIMGALQIKKISEQQYNGGTAPTLTTVYPKPNTNKPSTGNSSMDSLGKAQLKTRQGPLDYLKVNVTETDIRRVSTRVDVVENRSRIR